MGKRFIPRPPYHQGDKFNKKKKAHERGKH